MDIEQVKRLRAAGLTVREIAAAVGSTRSTVARTLAREPGPTERPRASVSAIVGVVTVKTNADAAVAGAAVKRALLRAGWSVD